MSEDRYLKCETITGEWWYKDMKTGEDLPKYSTPIRGLENDEKTVVKINMPLFEEKELEIFDNNIHSIIEEYSKLNLEKKEQILTQRIVMKQEEELDKYKQVIDKIKSNNQLIIDYGFDYDGFNNVEDLKKLIDMLVDYAVENKKILEEIE